MPEYQYDAFISYRHLPLDMAIASQTQKLLESYKPPKDIGKDRAIGKLFRDQTELPTSGDLGDSLQRALLSSQFLIVVLTPQLKESKWCMEEIRSFKEAHGGQISHILPILAEGEPADSIPDILRHETRKIKRPDGTEEWAEVEVEPLCCDVRSDSVAGSLKKLKTEFLRLAAPMLGVGYDDLYRRNQRKKHRQMAIAAGASSALFAAIAIIVGYFAFQTYQAKQNFQNNLVNTYAREGASQIVSGDDEKALLYYSSALNLDSSTQAAKTGALLLLQQQGWLNRISSESGTIVAGTVYTGDNPYRGNPYTSYTEQYGDFISTANDGSSWAYSTEDTVTFYFPDEGKAVQVDRPTKLNPACSTDMESAMNQEGGFSWAGTFDKEHAAICCGGYLYLYSLDLAAGTGEITDTYDLATIFTDDVTLDALPQYCHLWIASGGHMCVVYNGVTAAVINSHNLVGSCLTSLHEAYGQNLQSVAFSKDDQYYALVYGNNIGINNPGGCVEVYDMSGNQIMATEFDSGMPLTGAVFSPDGKQIAVWGNGILTVYDCQTGMPGTATLQVSNITEMIWTEGGHLIAETGNGVLDTYVINRFEASANNEISLVEYDEPDFYAYEGPLDNGITIKRTATSVSVLDTSGNEIDSHLFLDENAPISITNRMYTDTAHGTVYMWLNVGDSLLAYKADSTGFTSSLILNTRGQSPTSVHTVHKGIIAEMSTGELFYYEDGRTEPSGIIRPSAQGDLRSIASDENGLVSFVIRDHHFTDTYHYTDYFTAELWDLNKFVMLAELENNDSEEITQLTFTDGSLAYMMDGKTKVLLLNAPEPDTQLVETLSSMTCYTLDSDQNALVAVPAFDPAALGNWSDIIGEVKEEETAEPVEEGIGQQMARILEEQGEDAWFAEYEKWWLSDAPDQLTENEVIDLADDFVSDAWRKGHEDSVKAILERAFGIISKDLEPSLVVEENLTSLLSRVPFYSPDNVALVTDYYLARVNHLEEKYNSSDDLNDLVSLYAVSLDMTRVAGIDPLDYDVFLGGILPDDEPIASFLKCNELMQNALLIGSGETAARAWNLASDLQLITRNDILFYHQCLFYDLGGLVQRGRLSEETYSTFVKNLEHHHGYRVMWLTSADLDAGLQIGDLITSVSGIYFGQWQYINYKDPFDQPAELTVLRDGSEITISLPAGWTVGGANDYE